MTEGTDIIKANKITKRLDGLKKTQGNVSSKRIDSVLGEIDTKGIIQNKRKILT